jgi:osmotically-inducible protein OsmY
MRRVTIDARVAKAVAEVLRAHWTGAPRADAICHALSDIVMAATHDRTSPDETLKHKIIEELESVVPMDDALVDVEVRAGIVDLRGIVPSECKRRQICSVASGVGGVLTLHDHLIDVDLRSGAFLLSVGDSTADAGQPAPHGHGAHP